MQLLVLKEVKYAIHALENMVHMGGRYFNGKLDEIGRASCRERV